MKQCIFSAVMVCVVWFVVPGPALADYFDSFDDGYYARDPNDPRYDANDPYWTDPNNAVLWDIDNPDWTMQEVIGSTFYESASDGWLRLFADEPILPYAFCGGTVIDGDADPNTSLTYYDDSAPHYIVAKIKNYDPDKGEVLLNMHSDYVHWTSFVCSVELDTDDPCNPNDGRTYALANLNGTNWDGASPSLHRTDLDNAAGFWMVFQWDGDGDPNHSYIRTAAWNGNKFDWDGVWDLQEHVLTEWDPNNSALYQYWGEGLTGVAPLGSDQNGSPGFCDAKYDEIEVRWGTFTDVSRTLELTIKNGKYGTVTIDPDLFDDPNNGPHWDTGDPNIWVPADPNELRRYTDGTEICLTAEPAAGKSFKEWKIWDDPNHFGDGAYAVKDSNSVIYLTMDSDHAVEASFKCGSSSSAVLPLAIAGLGVFALIRRRV